MGKASDVDGGVHRATWDATTEAVSSGTDAGVVAGTGCHFSGFHGVGSDKVRKEDRHGRHLGGEGKACNHSHDGENAEDGEDGQHVEHIAGGGVAVKRFLKEVF